MRGKWERKENGEGKGGKGEHFPLLVRRENGRGKKMGKENSVGPMPIFLSTFSSQNGGILGQIYFPTLCPRPCALFSLTKTLVFQLPHQIILRSSALPCSCLFVIFFCHLTLLCFSLSSMSSFFFLMIKPHQAKIKISTWKFGNFIWAMELFLLILKPHQVKNELLCVY